jgi:hypothetical protein
MPDKCDLCALNISFRPNEQATAESMDAFFADLRQLQSSGVIGRGWPRRIIQTDETDDQQISICAINSEYFHTLRSGFETTKKNGPCPHFILRVGISSSDALLLHTAKSTDALTASIQLMTFMILLLTIVTIIVAIAQAI